MNETATRVLAMKKKGPKRVFLVVKKLVEGNEAPDRISPVFNFF